jgi:hypothetical protein
MSHPEYPPEWPEMRERAKNKAGFVCQLCGFVGTPSGAKKGSKKKIDAAHVDHDSTNPEARIIAICSWCHMFWDCKLHRESMHKTQRRRARLDLGHKKRNTKK